MQLGHNLQQWTKLHKKARGIKEEAVMGCATKLILTYMVK
jgi:hypothetical protein